MLKFQAVLHLIRFIKMSEIEKTSIKREFNRVAKPKVSKNPTKPEPKLTPTKVSTMNGPTLGTPAKNSTIRGSVGQPPSNDKSPRLSASPPSNNKSLTKNFNKSAKRSLRRRR